MTRLWNTSGASLTRAVQKRLEQRKYQPGWARIRSGVLEGVELLLPEGGTLWHEMVEGTYDQFLFDALSKGHPVRGRIMWDIGAHVGFHSLAFSALGAEVLAFEPNPVNIEQFKLNVQRNPKLAPGIRQLPLALSDSIGQMRFRKSDDLRGESSGGHLQTARPPLEEPAYASFNETVVQTTTIDRLLQEGERAPDILKIDVEGAEELVLKGGANFLANSSPVLLMEVHHICLMHGIQKLLPAWGFKTRLLDEAHATPSRCFLMAEK